jgi:choline dehydrogenase-like flavoprotein
MANVIADIDEVASAGYYRLTHRNYPLVSVQLVFIAEQTPNFHSRVFLGSERDALGVPYPVLDWRLASNDSEAVLRATQLLANQVGQAGLGRVALHFDSFDATPPNPHIHHMGTTRMSETESGGVVDRNCRVHGVSNLFIAGSSVFPTSGNVNPTLTLLALAFRTADHLKGAL